MIEEIRKIVSIVSNNALWIEIIVTILSAGIAVIVYMNTSKFELAFKTRKQQVKHRIANILVLLLFMMGEIVSAFFNISDTMFRGYLVLTAIGFGIMVLSTLSFIIFHNRSILSKVCTLFEIAFITSPTFFLMMVMEQAGEAYKQSKELQNSISLLLFCLIVCFSVLECFWGKNLKVGNAKAYYVEKGKVIFIYMAINEEHVITGIRKNMNDKNNEVHITSINKLEDKKIQPMQNEHMEMIECIQMKKEKIIIKFFRKRNKEEVLETTSVESNSSKKKNILKFREIKTEKLKTQIDIQCEVARKIQENMKEAGIPENIQGFELVKEILISNETSTIILVLEEVMGKFEDCIFKWVVFAITFLLGILATLIAENEKVDLNLVIFLLIIGCGIEFCAKLTMQKVENLKIRILKNMTYERYKFLINFDKEKFDNSNLATK